MNDHRSTPPRASRRDFLDWTARGLGGAALASLMLQDGTLQAAITPAEADDPWPHHPAPARRAIHICLCGGFSQVDSFDYKPALETYHGQKFGDIDSADVFFGQIGLLRQNDWAFEQRGESGLWVSELFPHLATVADELTVIRSMYAETSNHTPATFQENTGFRLNGFPTAGAWLSYGMGAETDELPAYVVIPDARGLPAGGSINWSNGFLPARHQGVVIRSQGTPIDDLFPAQDISPDTDAASRDLLADLNQRHLEARGFDDTMAARIKSYELAARMQLAVPEVTAIDGETEETHALYGIDHETTQDFGRSCLLARRLLQRGVRFVQLFSGGAFGSPRINWDGHEDMQQNHGREAARIDRPVAGLLHDLRRTGMLDDTLVVFTSEFGRTPFTQSASDVLGTGRDHNQYGFTTWLAGAGLKHGIAYGETDEIGWKAVVDRTHWHDFHATVLHLLGIDHERLTYYHNGIQRRLTNVHGHVIDAILDA
ncbi:MAG: DUF1501 domain-containing protein [Planctomycetota bacterium]|nr:MAG: DUF1501 domain-containing protein [Planctomycetota bacterium]REJ91566.1 MAG: DUF1501 domain-containing protein [Planctomycetota bacterium]REK20550.1 MAG: DUF1501 domain-containing protein [Planctomycetota bacterium]REK28326.1 MAG: DUF1501 domain-containing protein [Planctomycetota bacterium]